MPRRQASGPEHERGDVDLGLVALDRPHDRPGDLVGRTGADAGRQLDLRVGEHPRIADETGEDG